MADARPRVIVNCAISLDGRLAAPGGAPLRLSCDEDLVRVHRLRADVDAILVGAGTVLADDPGLGVKPGYADGDDPLRVVLDGRGRVPPSARVWRDDNAVWFTRPGVATPPDFAATHVVVPPAPGGRGVDLAAVFGTLHGRGVGSVLVEGGGHIIRSVLAAGLMDEGTVYVAPVLVGDDAPGLWPAGAGQVPVRFAAARSLGDGVLVDLAYKT